MAATNGTLILLGKSGRTYSVDLYTPDAVAGLIGFNGAGLASSTSPTTWRTPEDVVIKDFISVGAPTAVGASLNINGATANGGTIRFNNQLASLPNRAALNVGVRGGDFIGYTNF